MLLMKKLLALLHCSLFIIHYSFSQDPWIIKADKIDPNNYYGITVANGMIGAGV